MNPAPKQFSLNRAASRKQILITFFLNALLLAALTLGVNTTAPAADGTPAWTNYYAPEPPLRALSGASQIVLDGSDNVYVAGTYGGTVKYSNAGVQVWTNSANIIASDGSGNVHVTTLSGSYYITIKFSSAGLPLWTNRCGPVDISIKRSSFVLDDSGNAYLLGDKYSTVSLSDIVTIKYSRAGTPVWTNVYNGPGNGNDWARNMSLDGSGNVYVMGSVYSTVSGWDFATIKYSSAGTPVWTNSYTSPGNHREAGFIVGVALDGSVYVSGNTSPLAQNKQVTIKYSSAGVPVWTNIFSHRSGGGVLDGSGNVYITGSTATIKYSSAGVPVWTNIYKCNNEYLYSIALDGSTNVIVSGYDGNSQLRLSDIVTIKYSSAGVSVWTNIYNGPANQNDFNGTAAVDKSGNVYVTGATWVDKYNQVYNVHGLVESYVTIKYFGPNVPYITTQPVYQTVVLTSNATFFVAASGAAPLAYQWRFNGAAIPGGTNSSLTVSNASFARAGNYQVIVTNSHGSVTSSNAVLNVGIIPAITSQPFSLIVTQGQSASFSVTATGTQLNYYWKKNGTFIPSQTNSLLALASAVATDAANYTCQVSNFVGNVTSAIAVLTVHYPPTISLQPEGKTVGVGSNFTVGVTASGVPAIAYQWRTNGTSITGATASSYTVTGAQINHAADYDVVITNSVGSVTSGVAVVNVTLPMIWLNITANAAYAMQLQLTGQPDSSYVLQAATNLVPPIIWQPVLTNPADANGFWQFTDTNLNAEQKFYRVTTP